MKRKDMKRKDMNRQNKAAQMIGQVIQPSDERIVNPIHANHTSTAIAQPLTTAQPLQGATHSTALLPHTLSQDLALSLDRRIVAGSANTSEGLCPRYRITKLLGQEIGKRTFLAREESSQSQVVIKLLLFCPDIAEEEAALAEQQNKLPPYELPAYLPYIESFEASTPLGDGLILVKAYTEKAYAEEVRLSADGSGPASNNATDPTVHPRFAYGRMRVKVTAQKLQAQFPESYVRSGLSPSASNKTPTAFVEMWLLIVLGTVVFVGGVVATTGSILAGVVIAALLPVLYQTLWGSPPKRARIAKLRITSEPDRRAFISLTSVGMPIRDRTGRINGAPTNSYLHGSRLSIKSVKVSPTLEFSSGINPIKAKLSFTFHNHNWHSQSLSIVGSYAEIQWLSRHLSDWGRDRTASPKENRVASPKENRQTPSG